MNETEWMERERKMNDPEGMFYRDITYENNKMLKKIMKYIVLKEEIERLNQPSIINQTFIDVSGIRKKLLEELDSLLKEFKQEK